MVSPEPNFWIHAVSLFFSQNWEPKNVEKQDLCVGCGTGKNSESCPRQWQGQGQ